MSVPTREELIAVATHLHDEAGCGCDPKYLKSCPQFANAILRAGKVIRERPAPAPEGSTVSDNPENVRECCGLPMNTLDVFGIRIYRCSYRPHHPMAFRNLNTGEELAEDYGEGGGLEWVSHP